MKISAEVFKASRAGNIPLGIPVAAKVGSKDVLLIATEAGLLNIDTGLIVKTDKVSSYGEIDAVLTVESTAKVESDIDLGEEVGSAWVVETKDGKHWFHCWEPSYTYNTGYQSRAQLTSKKSGTLPTIYKIEASAIKTAKKMSGNVVQVTVNLGG